MTQYKTPGVYVEEVSTLPPSVVEVSTAIPAFIGCTEKGGPEGGIANADNPATVARISTLLDFEVRFGGPPLSGFSVTVYNGEIVDVDRSAPTDQGGGSILYYSISHFFKNGGGTCYIVSVGNYASTPVPNTYDIALDQLAKEDEPTLIVPTDATLLSSSYPSIASAALQQCATLGDRFAILDAPDVSLPDLGAFRTGLGDEHLKYGAVYYPSLRTTLTYQYEDSDVEVIEETVEFNTRESEGAAKTRTTKSKDNNLDDVTSEIKNLGQLKINETALYSRIKTALAKQTVTLPPSAAVAGIYASVDRQRGVWKAPANVGIAAVLGPTVKIDNADQEGLNVDPTSGKSINAIRSFTGKGTLVWGARTLDGNSNEWRYVPVRRLFIMLEESCQKATSFAVFEPNDLSTWLKVKGMIESFLYGLWEQGAFSGAKPEEAYYVHVGLGTTMTEDDILNGRMIVEVGVAAVRPAEFIVLRFSHKLQES